LLLFPFPNYTSSLKHAWTTHLYQAPLCSPLNTITTKQIILSILQTLNDIQADAPAASVIASTEITANTRGALTNMLLDLM